jgi:hypothetical protein
MISSLSKKINLREEKKFPLIDFKWGGRLEISRWTKQRVNESIFKAYVNPGIISQKISLAGQLLNKTHYRNWKFWDYF